MAITVLSDVIVPQSVIAAGVHGKQVRNNTRTQLTSGHMAVNVNWARTLRQYELGLVPMTVAQWADVEALYEVTDAGAFGMLLEDPKDRNATAEQGVLMPWLSGAAVGTGGLGYGVPVYRLHKRYAVAGGRYRDRLVSRPKGIPVLKRAGVTVVFGAGAGQATLAADSGAVTFAADLSASVSSYTMGVTTVLNFSGSTLPNALAVGGRVYLSGVSGTAAATLNGKSHAITAKASTSLTIDTVTTGLTASGGTAAKYPQPSETLTWSGDFYVPVHFADDDLDWEMVRPGADFDSRLIAGPSVVLMEVRE